MNNPVSIVMSTRNSEKYIERSISSALSQEYDKLEILFFDADSTDKTFEIASKFSGDARIRIFKNSPRKYQGENIRDGVIMSKPNSIVVTLDGDDWLPHNKVIQRVNEIYNENDCWMTYGTYKEFPERSVSHIYEEYPLPVRRKKLFRNYRWLASHLRTFRRELFLKIREEDLKDPLTGEYFSFAPDLSFQFPMLEMCGETRSTYVSDILYVYNVENPNNENKQDLNEIQRIEKYLRSMVPYETLEKL